MRLWLIHQWLHSIACRLIWDQALFQLNVVFKGLFVKWAVRAVLVPLFNVFRLLPIRVKLFHRLMQLFIWDSMISYFVNVSLNSTVIHKVFNLVCFWDQFFRCDFLWMNVLNWKGGNILDINFDNIWLREIKRMCQVVLLAWASFVNMGYWREDILCHNFWILSLILLWNSKWAPTLKIMCRYFRVIIKMMNPLIVCEANNFLFAFNWS